ncbi:hypothetical protein Desca_1551 [Desulfotomaculum nigrificans CO-1-SRB]|uniref:Uncharacterized protein n=1 Tax=Desulfotomaculum nigrificans (strain DSM 14880 / VKM B-2319 / CO-1-SRB) TaxID=868595 RepID=F6B6N2_DESCC|nr:hypothetical protein [Desulfotomaculum nigrificans]AEF94406.1 hypothetical protein Desca_1551 [Desulfotomaculum nigrificans CO-1-SRB]
MFKKEKRLTGTNMLTLAFMFMAAPIIGFVASKINSQEKNER